MPTNTIGMDCCPIFPFLFIYFNESDIICIMKAYVHIWNIIQHLLFYPFQIYSSCSVHCLFVVSEFPSTVSLILTYYTLQLASYWKVNTIGCSQIWQYVHLCKCCLHHMLKMASLTKGHKNILLYFFLRDTKFFFQM